MRNNRVGQVFKGLGLLCACLFLLVGCITSRPYQSPWVLPYPTTDKQRAESEYRRPAINWRTEERRESLQVYYDEGQRQRVQRLEQQDLRPKVQKELFAYEQQNVLLEQVERKGITQENLYAPTSPNYVTPLTSAVTVPNKKITVALLLPMSGKYKHLGLSMMNAAQMALFDLDTQAFSLLPKDTKGTSAGARKAALEAAEAGADLILGPVFSDSVSAVKSVLAYADIPVITYTTNWKMAGDSTYVMGFLPFSQVIRVVNYAQNHGYTKTGFFGPGNDYSNIVLRTLHYSLRRHGNNIARTGQFSVGQPDMHVLVQDFIGVDIPDEIGPGDETELVTVVADDIVLPFDSVLVPVGGETLKTVSNMFGYYNVGKDRVRFLGTGLWDDPSLINEETLYGSWFSAPDPALRADFEKRYEENYDEEPERLASLAYDSLALAIVLAKTYSGVGGPYSRDRLVTEQGYAGIDGIFRFRKDNLVERGLAVLEVTPTGLKVIDSAPDAFFVYNN